MDLTFWRPVQESFWTRSDPASLTPLWTGGPQVGTLKYWQPSTRIESIAESTDGRWRLVPVNAELVCVPRWLPGTNTQAIYPITGTRRPAAPGYGWVLPEPTVVEKVVEKIVTVEDTARLDAVKKKVADLAADVAND